MNIKGVIKNSFLDWDGKIASIIFTGGCNFSCPFCHNKSLANDNSLVNINLDELFKYLQKNKKWIDGIVISGGEPTTQKDLIAFMKKVKEKGFLIKLDTNGYKPEIIKESLEKKLVDYIAMDIKTGIKKDKYIKAIGFKNKIQQDTFDLHKIFESIKLIRDAKDKVKNFDFEFRTTICPVFVGLDDLLNIAENIGNAKWYWQNFRKLGDLIDNQLKLINSYSILELDEFEKIVKTEFADCDIRKRY
ncbi:MAG: anaerobic ribonucleoside-triphosphate reductase activating protein [Elusimicrobiota bacterium]|jgi:pyruvate formate lyase activating enzyme|nr:anaerobic ribonucleoside-triphosphate reductase activating protein [Elusimicrobiota bacterium]